jgi:hypothetical protein
MVEGRSRHTLRNNHSNHPVQFAKNIARRDPEHGEPVRFKVDLAQAVDSRGAPVPVNLSVNLDQQ